MREEAKSESTEAAPKPGSLARGVALLGALGALALPLLTIAGFLYEAQEARALRDDGTLDGAVGGVADGFSAACALTAILPFALIVVVAAGAAIVDSLGSASGRAAGSLAVLYGCLTGLFLFVFVHGLIEDAERTPPEALVVVAIVALVSLANLQAWRLARRR
jgi:hypothetical protein